MYHKRTKANLLGAPLGWCFLVNLLQVSVQCLAGDRSTNLLVCSWCRVARLFGQSAPFVNHTGIVVDLILVCNVERLAIGAHFLRVRRLAGDEADGGKSLEDFHVLSLRMRFQNPNEDY